MTQDARLNEFIRLAEIVEERTARRLQDGRVATVLLQFYNSRLVVGTDDDFYDDGW